MGRADEQPGRAGGLGEPVGGRLGDDAVQARGPPPNVPSAAVCTRATVTQRLEPWTCSETGAPATGPPSGPVSTPETCASAGRATREDAAASVSRAAGTTGRGPPIAFCLAAARSR